VSYTTRKRAWEVKHPGGTFVSWKKRKRLQRDVQVLGRDRARAEAQRLLKSSPEFRAHIEAQFQPGMSWENYPEWEVDHVVALAQFDLGDPAQYAKAASVSNHQPVWAILNNRAQHRSKP